MTIFGNRDSSYGTAPSAEAVEHPTELPATATSSRGFGAVDNRRVVLRVHGDEQIVIGTNGEWPQIDERFIRPGAIVSVDVQRSE